ncbi:MAG: LysR family transcriptional regulator [Burkholderiaceae bacterium]
MDLILAKTFLEVIESGNFHSAAERLHVTQSTVSTRISSLETELGRKLFVRRKSGTVLTLAGAHFRLYAQVLINTWQHACQDIVLPAGVESLLSIGSEFAIWDSFLVGWVSGFRIAHAHIGLRAELGDPAWITRQLAEGLLDIGITYSPIVRTGLAVETLYVEKLVLVSNHPRGVMRWSPDYIYMDWGDEIRAAHRSAYPGGNRPSLTGSIGPLCIRLVLDSGGSGYFPYGSVRRYVREGRLFIVDGAPVFDRTVYCIYQRSEAVARRIKPMLAQLRAAAEPLEKIEPAQRDTTTPHRRSVSARARKARSA